MTVCLTLPVAEAASCAFVAVAAAAFRASSWLRLRFDLFRGCGRDACVAVAAAAFRASSWLRPRFDLSRGCGRDACDAQVCPNVFSETQNMQEQ
jgi:hypothetical protein